MYGGRVDDDKDFLEMRTLVGGVMRSEAFGSQFVLGKGGDGGDVLAPEECLSLGGGKGGASSWVRETVAGDA